MIDTDVLSGLGQIAGLAGLSIGLVLLIFRDAIRMKIFSPNIGRENSYQLMRQLLYLTWSIAVIGILVWGFLSYQGAEISQDRPVEVSASGNGTAVVTTGENSPVVIDRNDE